MNLYEISVELREIMAEMEEIALSDINELEKEKQIYILECKYEQLAGSKEQKALDLVRYYKSLSSDAKAIDEEIKNLTARKKAKENKAESIKKFLGNIIQPGTKLEDATAKISWRKSEKLVCDDIDFKHFPKEVVRMVPKVNKTELKKYCKEHGSTKWYHIEENQNLQLK